MKRVILIICLFMLVYWLGNCCNTKENFVADGVTPLKHKRCDTYNLQPIEMDFLKDNFTKTDDDDYQLYSMCDYTHAQQELEQNNYFKDKKDTVIATIDGIDNIAAKDGLWKLLYKHYGRKGAEKLVPQTWLTYDSDQMNEFYKTEFPKDAKFIKKKNIQAQKGLSVFTDKVEAKNAFSEGYVVIQRILDDPYLIEGRKLNYRVYVLITCTGNRKRIYRYLDGFLYYGQDPLGEGKTDRQIITTGYLDDRSVYDRNPLTLQEFGLYLNKTHGFGTSDKVNRMINEVIRNVFAAFKQGICKATEGNEIVYAQLYGADLQMNENMSQMHVIEYNKGPSLTVMDDKDGGLKRAMIADYYAILGLVPFKVGNKFIEL